MDNRQKRLLKQQLEQQAARFTTETSDEALLASILTTCNALLRTAQKSMPVTFTAQGFDQILAGYLGVESLVRSFCQSSQGHIQGASEQQMRSLEGQISDFQTRLQELQNQINGKRTEASALNKRMEQARKQLTQAQIDADAAKQEYDTLTRQEEACHKQEQTLRQEAQRIRKRTEHFERDIQQLAEEFHAAQETYQEMTAYYQELGRIEAGIQAEGFADIQSFSEHLAEMNQQGHQLMAAYDQLLKAMLTDIAELQDRIQERQKPGQGK